MPWSARQGLEPLQSTSGEQDSGKVRSPQLLGGEQAGKGGARHGEGYCRGPRRSALQAVERLRIRWENHLEGSSHKTLGQVGGGA